MVGLRRFDSRSYRENGPMENTQAACLFATMLLFVWNLYLAKEGTERIFLLGVCLVSGTFLVLEVDLRKVEIPALNRVWNGSIRNAWLGALWIGAFLLFVRQAVPVLACFLDWSRSRAGTLFLLGCLLWLLSALVDKAKPFTSLADNLMGEELIENNATLFMLCSTVLSCGRETQL